MRVQDAQQEERRLTLLLEVAKLEVTERQALLDNYNAAVNKARNRSRRGRSRPIIHPAIIHGKTCQKVVHDEMPGHLHGPDDDSPYMVDDVRYCGRCHVALVP